MARKFFFRAFIWALCHPFVYPRQKVGKHALYGMRLFSRKFQAKNPQARVEKYPQVVKSHTATEELKDPRRYQVHMAKGKTNVCIPEGRPV